VIASGHFLFIYEDRLNTPNFLVCFVFFFIFRKNYSLNFKMFFFIWKEIAMLYFTRIKIIISKSYFGKILLFLFLKKTQLIIFNEFLFQFVFYLQLSNPNSTLDKSFICFLLLLLFSSIVKWKSVNSLSF